MAATFMTYFVTALIVAKCS